LIRSYKEKALRIYQMTGEGQMVEAFEKFYHDDVVVVDAVGDVREGKSAIRDRFYYNMTY